MAGTCVETPNGLVYNLNSVSIRQQLACRERKVANQTGKRYICQQCKSEFIVTKGGDGSVSCCGAPMELK